MKEEAIALHQQASTKRKKIWYHFHLLLLIQEEQIEIKSIKYRIQIYSRKHLQQSITKHHH